MYFDKQKYVVIIPSYNEIKTLPKWKPLLSSISDLGKIINSKI